jgi:hypothetical protein
LQAAHPASGTANAAEAEDDCKAAGGSDSRGSRAGGSKGQWDFLLRMNEKEIADWHYGLEEHPGPNSRREAEECARAMMAGRERQRAEAARAAAEADGAAEPKSTVGKEAVEMVARAG